MALAFSEKEKKELKDHLTVNYEEMRLSYFEYKQLHYLYCIHESLVNIAGNLQQIINTETIRKNLPK
jgi:hypothetical protein